MTYFDLKAISRQIKDQELEIKEIREKGCKVTKTISDMPRGGGVSDKPCDTACDVDYAERELARLQEQFNDGMNSIPDKYIKKAIHKKLAAKWTWNQIAMWLSDGTVTGNSLRMLCTRYKW